MSKHYVQLDREVNDAAKRSARDDGTFTRAWLEEIINEYAALDIQPPPPPPLVPDDRIEVLVELDDEQWRAAIRNAKAQGYDSLSAAMPDLIANRRAAQGEDG